MNPSTISVFGSDAEAGFLERPFLDCSEEDGTGTGALYEAIVLENDKFLENLPPTLEAEDSIELGASGETPSEIEREFSGDGGITSDDTDDSNLQLQTIMTATCGNKNLEGFKEMHDDDEVEEKGFLWDGEGDADYDPDVHRLEREILGLTVQIEQGTSIIQEKWEKMDQIRRHQEESVKGILLRKNLEKCKRDLQKQIRELIDKNNFLQTRKEHHQLEVLRLKKPIMEPPRRLGTPRPQSWEDRYFEEDPDEYQLFHLF